MLASSLVLLLATLPQESSRARVTARFVDPQGASVVDVDVLNRVWPGAEFRCVTDANGRFESIVEWPGDHRRAQHAAEEVQPAQHRVRIASEMQRVRGAPGGHGNAGAFLRGQQRAAHIEQQIGGLDRKAVMLAAHNRNARRGVARLRDQHAPDTAVTPA